MEFFGCVHQAQSNEFKALLSRSPEDKPLCKPLPEQFHLFSKKVWVEDCVTFAQRVVKIWLDLYKTNVKGLET